MIDGLIEAYCTHLQAEGRSPSTIRWHRGSLGLFADWLKDNGHDLAPDHWNATLIRLYFVWLQQAPTKRGKQRTDHTVASYAISIRAFCHWLEREEFVQHDIVARVKVPKVPQLAKPTLNDQEVQRLIEAAKRTRTSHRDAALLLLALDTGLRCSELATLQLDDVDWKERSAKVMGKGARERYVVFSATTSSSLQRYVLKGRATESNTLFVSEEGHPLTTSGIYQICRRLGDKAGVHLNPHKLRHSFVTMSLRNGASPFLVQRQCGHRDLETTLRYAHLTTHDMARAHDSSSPVASVLRPRARKA